MTMMTIRRRRFDFKDPAKYSFSLTDFPELSRELCSWLKTMQGRFDFHLSALDPKDSKGKARKTRTPKDTGPRTVATSLIESNLVEKLSPREIRTKRALDAEDLAYGETIGALTALRDKALKQFQDTVAPLLAAKASEPLFRCCMKWEPLFKSFDSLGCLATPEFFEGMIKFKNLAHEVKMQPCYSEGGNSLPVYYSNLIGSYIRVVPSPTPTWEFFIKPTTERHRIFEVLTPFLMES